MRRCINRPLDFFENQPTETSINLNGYSKVSSGIVNVEVESGQDDCRECENCALSIVRRFLFVGWFRIGDCTLDDWTTRLLYLISNCMRILTNCGVPKPVGTYRDFNVMLCTCSSDILTNTLG